MKKIVLILLIGLFTGCGNGATDQDAETDTTNMPADPNVGKDTVNHINRDDGTQMLDTNAKDDSAR